MILDDAVRAGIDQSIELVTRALADQRGDPPDDVPLATVVQEMVTARPGESPDEHAARVATTAVAGAVMTANLLSLVERLSGRDAAEVLQRLATRLAAGPGTPPEET